MRIGSLEFSPRILPTLAVVALLPLLTSLGLWQLDRAAEKQVLQTLLQERLEKPAEHITKAGDLAADMTFRQTILDGYFDPKHQYLLDNRIYRGQTGYSVYTPFSLDMGKSWIMVNRGWIAAARDRNKLPDIEVSGEKVRLEGVLGLPPGQLMQLAAPDPDSSNSWPQRIQNLELEQVGRDTGLRLHDYVLHLDASSEHAYQQDWTPYVDTPQKNHAYAIQWFSMAVVLLLIYIGLNTRRLKRPLPQNDEEE
ncbi:SURF1 family protein [Sulfuriflexus sp.]|uniref:SURF1 family protein n=1 Tax=Sulfuriflexus sp. TaxID=2015443 RepID=UPI0028CF42F8|nr:SURF1 family protein [Sulfuriflexus sp.]MDT8403568.1 SURF1 family protein [Sulfuriflexus sp.]